MNDIQLVKISYSTDDVLEESAGLNFLQFSLLDYIIEELSFLDIFHH